MIIVEKGGFIVIEPSGFRTYFDKIEDAQEYLREVRENNQISD